MRVLTQGSAFWGSDWLFNKTGGVGAQKSRNFSLAMRSARTEQPIFIVNGSKCVFWRKKVPLWGLNDFRTKLGTWGPKNHWIFAVQCDQPERSNRISSLMAQNACFHVGKCLLGVSLTFEKKLGACGPKNPKICALQWAQRERSNRFSSLMAQKCVFWRKEVPFGGLIGVWKKFVILFSSSILECYTNQKPQILMAKT